MLQRFGNFAIGELDMKLHIENLRLVLEALETHANHCAQAEYKKGTCEGCADACYPVCGGTRPVWFETLTAVKLLINSGAQHFKIAPVDNESGE